MDEKLKEYEATLKKLNADKETKRVYEARAKALSDERSRIEDAKDEGMLKVVKSLLSSGMPLAEVANHTPYSVEELRERLQKENTDNS